MTVLLWVVATLLLGDLALMGYLIFSWIADPQVDPSLTDLTPLIVGSGVLIAIVTLITNMRREASEEFLESATKLLAQAHDSLEVLDAHGRPKNERKRWLIASRLLRASERTAEHITASSHKRIYAEQREYWRARFNDLINPSIEGFPEDYYAESPEKMIVWHGKDRDPLAESSLAVLYRFVRWPEGLEDPVKNEPDFTEEEIERMRAFGPRGLGDLLAKVKSLKSGG